MQLVTQIHTQILEYTLIPLQNEHQITPPWNFDTLLTRLNTEYYMINPKLHLVTAILLLALSACSSSDDSSSGLESNATAQRLSEITRNIADGNVETRTIEYTESGNIAREIYKRDGNIYWTSTYDTRVDGQLIRRSDDVDQDDIENFSSTYSYENGRGLARIYRMDITELIYQVEIFRFDGVLVVSRDSRDVDDVATPDLVDETSGTLLTRRTFEYENDLVTLINIDTNGNGESDRQEILSYNADGTLASTTLSSFTEGAISSSTYTYEIGSCNRNSGNSFTNFYCVEVN